MEPVFRGISHISASAPGTSMHDASLHGACADQVSLQPPESSLPISTPPPPLPSSQLFEP
jgi:hypothetical protein